MGDLQYFLEIVVSRNKNEILLSYKKYIYELLIEIKCEQLKTTDTPFEVFTKFVPQRGDKLADLRRYRQLVGKPIYLIVTRPHISFAVIVISLFIQELKTTHWETIIRIMSYVRKTLVRGLFYKDMNPLDIQYFVDSDWKLSLVTYAQLEGEC